MPVGVGGRVYAVNSLVAKVPARSWAETRELRRSVLTEVSVKNRREPGAPGQPPTQDELKLVALIVLNCSDRANSLRVVCCPKACRSQGESPRENRNEHRYETALPK